MQQGSWRVDGGQHQGPSGAEGGWSGWRGLEWVEGATGERQCFLCVSLTHSSAGARRGRLLRRPGHGLGEERQSAPADNTYHPRGPQATPRQTTPAAAHPPLLRWGHT